MTLQNDSPEIRVSITRTDLVRLSLSRFPRTRSTWVLWFVIAGCLLVMDFVSDGIPVSPRAWGRTLFIASFAATFALIFGLVFSLVQILLASKTTNGVLGEHIYFFTKDGLVERTAVNEGVTKWGGAVAVSQTDSYLLIQIAPVLFFILPRRAFSDDAQYKQFGIEAQKLVRTNA